MSDKVNYIFNKYENIIIKVIKLLLNNNSYLHSKNKDTLNNIKYIIYSLFQLYPKCLNNIF